MGGDKLPTLLEAAKAALRISADTADFDGEVAALIQAAKRRMAMAGVSEDAVGDDSDPMVRLGCIVFCRATFGLDNPEAERLGSSFEDILCQMALSGRYTGAEVSDG